MHKIARAMTPAMLITQPGASISKPPGSLSGYVFLCPSSLGGLRSVDLRSEDSIAMLLSATYPDSPVQQLCAAAARGAPGLDLERGLPRRAVCGSCRAERDITYSLRTGDS